MPMTGPDQRSDAAVLYRKWYSSARWKRIAKAQRDAHPLCKFCLEDGRIEQATACDHVEPHRGEAARFWSGPFQSLCEIHHNGTKQRTEARGYSSAVGVDGWPLDPDHPANRDDARRLARLMRQGAERDGK